MSKLLFFPHPSPSLASTRYPELPRESVIKLAPPLAPLVPQLVNFTFKTTYQTGKYLFRLKRLFTNFFSIVQILYFGQRTSTRGAMGPWLKPMAPRVEVPCAASWGQCCGGKSFLSFFHSLFQMKQKVFPMMYVGKESAQANSNVSCPTLAKIWVLTHGMVRTRTQRVNRLTKYANNKNMPPIQCHQIFIHWTRK